MSAEEIRGLIKGYVNKRAAVKRKITNAFTRAESDKSKEVRDACTVNIRTSLIEIDQFNEKINDAYSKLSNDDDLSEDFISELDKQSDYGIDIQAQLSELITVKQIEVPESKEKTSFNMKLPD